jgi:hypothetical protein
MADDDDDVGPRSQKPVDTGPAVVILFSQYFFLLAIIILIGVGTSICDVGKRIRKTQDIKL